MMQGWPWGLEIIYYVESTNTLFHNLRHGKYFSIQMNCTSISFLSGEPDRSFCLVFDLQLLWDIYVTWNSWLPLCFDHTWFICLYLTRGTTMGWVSEIIACQPQGQTWIYLPLTHDYGKGRHTTKCHWIPITHLYLCRQPHKNCYIRNEGSRNTTLYLVHF